MKNVKKSMIHIVFVLSLFCLIAVTGIFAVVFGAKIYDNIQNNMQNNFLDRTADLYIANKLHSFDYIGGVNVEDNTFILKKQYDETLVTTYIYGKDGHVYEITVTDAFDFNYEGGTEILEADTFNVDVINENVVKVVLIKDNVKRELYFSVMSGVNKDI